MAVLNKITTVFPEKLRKVIHKSCYLLAEHSKPPFSGLFGSQCLLTFLFSVMIILIFFSSSLFSMRIFSCHSYFCQSWDLLATQIIGQKLWPFT